MSHPRTAWVLAEAVASVAVTAACGGSSSAPTSSVPAGGGGGQTSHNAGQDCHRDFAVAGTVYRADGSPHAGATVRLTTAAGGGGLVLSLTSDASGNFHSAQSVGFGAGLFADVASTSGSRSMAAAATSGACNSCHDAANRIRAD